MLKETIDHIAVRDGVQNRIVDATLGLGGHAIEMIARLNPGDIFIGFDLDQENLDAARENIFRSVGDTIKNKNIVIHLVHGSFGDLRNVLESLGLDSITGIYYDLGVSSAHFDDPKRGFSFRFDAPLDMRFDRTSQNENARDWINTASENELYRVFREYGEEPKAKFIVQSILAKRKQSEITTTKELEEIIRTASFDPKSVVRVFQAIRMEVNHELDVIKSSLEDAIDLLSPGGRCAVITFHSLEDRLTKHVFTELLTVPINPITGHNLRDPSIEKITKKPLLPSETEIERNPRSRSAKLRVVEKR